VLRRWETAYLNHTHTDYFYKVAKYYEEILNHPFTSDDLRRSTEAKLLEYRQKFLLSLPSDMATKNQLSNDLQEFIRGIVLLNIPNELAWTLYFETRDQETIGKSVLCHLSCSQRKCPGNGDIELFSQFIQLFPSSPLSKFLAGYQAYQRDITKPTGVHDDEDKQDASSHMDSEAGFDLMLVRLLYFVHSCGLHIRIGCLRFYLRPTHRNQNYRDCILERRRLCQCAFCVSKCRRTSS
jgi:hypothetical protein